MTKVLSWLAAAAVGRLLATLRPLAAAVVLCTLATPAVAIDVTNTATANSAIAAATGGETITLTGNGADYTGELQILNKAYSSPVTIVAAQGVTTQFNRVNLNNSQNVIIDGVTVVNTNNDSAAVLFSNGNSDTITFRNGTVSGNRDGTTACLRVLGADDNLLTNVTISNNTMRDCVRGVAISRGGTVTIANNHLYDFQQDGIFIGSSQNVTIEDNLIRRLWADWAQGQHGDCIQFYNEVGSNVNFLGAAVRRNRCFTSGGYSNQGIFLNQDNAALDFTDYVIENNVIVNGVVHGISFKDAAGGPRNVRVRNNTILTHQVPVTTAVSRIQIDPAGGTDCVNDGGFTGNNFENNIATGYSLTSGCVAAGNITASFDPATRGSGLHYDDLFLNMIGGPVNDHFAVLPVPGSQADFGSGKGAEAYLATLPRPRAWMRLTRGTGQTSHHVWFAAENYPGGGIAQDATFTWDLGNGQTATGRYAKAVYHTPGVYTVTLTVTQNGDPRTYTKYVEVGHPLLVDFDFDANAVNRGWSGGTVTVTGTPVYVSRGYGSSAFDFDADGSKRIDIAGAQKALSGIPTITFAADVYEQTAANASLIELYNSFGLRTTATNLQVLLRQAGGGYSAVINVAKPANFNGNWRRVAVTYDGRFLRLYVDGTQIGSHDFGSTANIFKDTTARKFAVGWDGLSGNFFNGYLDNVRVYAGVVPPVDEAPVATRLKRTGTSFNCTGTTIAVAEKAADDATRIILASNTAQPVFDFRGKTARLKYSSHPDFPGQPGQTLNCDYSGAGAVPAQRRPIEAYLTTSGGIQNASSVCLSGGRVLPQIAFPDRYTRTQAEFTKPEGADAYCGSSNLYMIWAANNVDYGQPPKPMTIEGMRLHQGWDGIMAGNNNCADAGKHCLINIRDVWISDTRDDCIEADPNPELRIENVLCDGTFMGISSNLTSGDDKAALGLVSQYRSFYVRLAPVGLSAGVLIGRGPWKMGNKAPKWMCKDCVIAFERNPDTATYTSPAQFWSEGWDRYDKNAPGACDGDNYVLYTGGDTWPTLISGNKDPRVNAATSGCWQVKTGRAAREHWAHVRNRFIDAHPDLMRAPADQ